MDVVVWHGVKWFGGLTSDFWAENGKRKMLRAKTLDYSIACEAGTLASRQFEDDNKKGNCNSKRNSNGRFPAALQNEMRYGMTIKKLGVRGFRGLGEDFGEVPGLGVGVLGYLFAAAKAIADDDGVGVAADGGE